MSLTITLSWFHRKIGPTIYYEYPEGSLQPEELQKIPDLMDTKFEEGFFSHSFETLHLFNYFFEVSSKWARGQKEMLLMSVCFTDPIPTQIQQEILVHCIEFANRLKKTNEIYKAFYEDGPPSTDTSISDQDKSVSLNLNKMLKIWMRDLYWNIISFSREKSEEETIAELLSQKSVFDIIQFLSNGPVAKEDLSKWYTLNFPDLELEEILSKLEAEKFIFQNVIGHDTFVLLVKETKVQRAPPDCIIPLIQEKSDLADLTDEFLARVKTFFDDYKTSNEDSIQLVNLVANPEIYNVLLQLRAGPIAKDQISSMIDREPVKNLMGILKVLREKKIIDEFEYKDESLVLLIDDIQFTTSFPSYLSKLTSKKTHPSIVKSYKTKWSPIKEIQPRELGNLDDEVFSKLKKISKQKTTNPEDEEHD